MAARSNAGTELTRLWLEFRHDYLVRESLQVPVKGNYSDVDFLAVHVRMGSMQLPDGTALSPRIAVETKDEHDGVPPRDFAKLLLRDLDLLNGKGVVERDTSGVKFTMLKEEHFETIKDFFGSVDFDRLLVVHAFDFGDRKQEAIDRARQHRIYWLTLPELARDLFQWYEGADRRKRIAMRNVITGDLFHLLVGYCGFRPS